MIAILFAIGAGALAYVGMMVLFPGAFASKEEKRTKGTLEELYRDTQQTLEGTQKIVPSLTKRDFSDLTNWARFFYQLPLMRNLYSRVLEAGYVKSAELFLFYFFLTSFIATVIFLQMGTTMLAPLLGLGLGYISIFHLLKHRVRQRSQEFLELFPDALDMIVRSVRSGFPLSVALQLVAENMEDPVKTEFATVVEEISMGRPLTETISRLTHRINEQDVNFFAIILIIQQETGGNLAEILSNLSNVIRQRKQLRNKVKAITSEGRTTAWIMGGLPVFLFFVIHAMEPNYMAPFFNSTLGTVFLGGAALLVVGCIAVIYKLVNIDI